MVIIVKNNLVSVIIPVYNRENTIERAIESVLLQTYNNIEIIVVNDNSTDNTEKILLEKYGDKICYIKNNDNLKVSYSRNNGIKHSHGKYIAFLDSDDEWYPWHISESIAVLKKTGYSVCSSLWEEKCYDKKYILCNSEYYNSEHGETLEKELGICVNQKIWKFPKTLYEYILKTDFYCFHINTIVLKKEVIDDIGYFDENLKSSEDMDFCYRIFKKYPLVTINKAHFCYYYGHDNLWAFADREKDLSEYTYFEKKKIEFTTNQKIKFFIKLLKDVESDDLLIQKKEIKEHICLNIVKRYLTLKYLFNNEIDIGEIRKYAISTKINDLITNNVLDDYLVMD